jgi:hypothetical protein
MASEMGGEFTSHLCEVQPHGHYSATLRRSLSFSRFCHGNGGENGSQAAVGKSVRSKITASTVETPGRRADRSLRTIFRFVAVLAALLALAVYWSFGTFSPCGVLREAIRQRSDLVAIFPDGVIDFAFEAQFGDMSAKRCFVVLFEAVTLPVLSAGQTSQQSMQQFAPRKGK